MLNSTKRGWIQLKGNFAFIRFVRNLIKSYILPLKSCLQMLRRRNEVTFIRLCWLNFAIFGSKHSRKFGPDVCAFAFWNLMLVWWEFNWLILLDFLHSSNIFTPLIMKHNQLYRASQSGEEEILGSFKQLESLLFGWILDLRIVLVLHGLQFSKFRHISSQNQTTQSKVLSIRLIDLLRWVLIISTSHTPISPLLVAVRKKWMVAMSRTQRNESSSPNGFQSIRFIF